MQVILAIGADDVFLFCAAVQQETEGNSRDASPTERTLQLRLSFERAWARSSYSMAVTSFTSCATFLMNMSSPLSETADTGLFIAIVIFLDYLFVILLLPPAVFLYEKSKMAKLNTSKGTRRRRPEDSLSTSWFFALKWSDAVMGARMWIALAGLLFTLTASTLSLSTLGKLSSPELLIPGKCEGVY